MAGSFVKTNRSHINEKTITWRHRGIRGDPFFLS
jgi:hypothetical protein